MSNLERIIDFDYSSLISIGGYVAAFIIGLSDVTDYAKLGAFLASFGYSVWKWRNDYLEKQKQIKKEKDETKTSS